jgi:hypothetical protein
MKPHQLRVVEEKKELDEKRDKLFDFIGTDTFNSLPGAEQERLKEQRKIMADYSNILEERIGAFD